MVIYKSFTCSAGVEEAVEMTIPGTEEVIQQYPTAAKCVAENIISAVAELGVEMMYHEESSQLHVGDARFVLIYGRDNLYAVSNGTGEVGVCQVAQANVVSEDAITQDMSICVRGTSSSFEVIVGVQDFFGIYTFERVFDNKRLTAIRKNDSNGRFCIFDEGEFLEYAEIIIPDNGQYSSSAYQVSGVALVPAVCTSFAYRILDAFLYIPFLQSGAYYEIADFSVVAAASCVLLVC